MCIWDPILNCFHKKKTNKREGRREEEEKLISFFTFSNFNISLRFRNLSWVNVCDYLRKKKSNFRTALITSL